MIRREAIKPELSQALQRLHVFVEHPLQYRTRGLVETLSGLGSSLQLRDLLGNDCALLLARNHHLRDVEHWARQTLHQK